MDTINYMNKNKKILGIPYNFQKPNKKTFMDSYYNINSPLFTPKVYGIGYVINFYPILHPFKYINFRRKK